jgi:sulfur-oxidizing protein SoxA
MKQLLTMFVAVLAMALPWQTATAQAAGKAKAGVKITTVGREVEDEGEAAADFAKFRAILEDANPAELFEAQGSEFWAAPRGPNKVSLAKTCDLGLGIGKTRGAYVQMPRYFKDAGAVMDAERRIIWCMVNKQGFKEADLAKKPFSGNNDPSAPEQTSLVTYIAAQSAGMKFAVPMKDPKVKESYEIGEVIAKHRAGPYDFSCTTCHGLDGKRIRLQNLPNITTKKGATRAVLGWPGYRLTGNRMLSLQWRMNDCFRQQRFPEPNYASDTVTSLLTYMTGNANGATYKGPGIKR